MFSIVAAVGKNRELGKSGKLVFHIKEDVRFFKNLTMGHKILMGLNTFCSLPGALAGRENYVLTKNPKELGDEVKPITDLDKFIKKYVGAAEEVFVIGGGVVYRELLPYAKNLYLTEIEAETDADVYFPEFDAKKYDKIILKKGESDGLKYTFTKYVLKPNVAGARLSGGR